MQLFKKIVPFSYLILLVIIEILLIVANYTPKTFLVGWDNIMPEFNITLNYQRAIASVWQDYRGLGTLDGMAHAANLAHTFYIHLLSFVIPENALRYAYVFITHIAGGIAFYFLALRILKNKHSSFLGSLFYLFNIGIIQMYYAPLEVFATHFAALPIMGLAMLHALKHKTKQSLFFLGIASILTSPQAFVPTVFVAHAIFVGFIMLFSMRKKLIKRLVTIAAILFITNAFWLLPFSYSAVAKSDEVKNTRINEFSSDEIYYRNAARGNAIDVLTLKGFMLDAIEYDTFKNQNYFFMQSWRDHLHRPLANILQLIFAGFLLIGSVVVLKFRLKSLYPFLAANIVSFVFLANNTFGIESINQTIRTLFPIFGEAFRFPFTKFITLFAFSYAILFALGVSFIIKAIVNYFTTFVHKIYPNRYRLLASISYGLLVCLVIICVFYVSLPAFKGGFFSEHLRLSIPIEYQQASAYFKNQNPNGRILTFPMHSFWNWEYRSWGHRGSGFFWYSIPQPILIRAFDPWSRYNEQLFNEISTAYTKGNIKVFDDLLDKYDVSYILVDKSVINTISPRPINYEKVNEFIEKSLSYEKDFENDLITVYRSKIHYGNTSIIPKDGVVSVNELSPQSSTDNIIDEAYYISNGKKADIIFPFSSLSTLKLQKDNAFSWRYENNKITFEAQDTSTVDKARLVLPSLFQYEFLIPVRVSTAPNQVLLTPIYPVITVNDKVIDVSITPITITTSIQNPTSITFIDIGQQVASQGGKAFLQNNFLNTLKISNGTTDEYVQLNTSYIPRTSQVIEFEEPVRSINIETELFDTEFGKGDYVQNDQFIVNQVSKGAKLKNPSSYSHWEKTNDGVLLESISDTTSLDIYLQPVVHAASYMVIVDVDRKAGLPLNFYVDNPSESTPVFESKLDNDGLNIAIIPPTDSHSKGYGFHFGIKSVGNEIASSVIRNIRIFPFPQRTIEMIRFTNPTLSHFVRENSVKTPIQSTQFSNFYYKFQNPQEGVITLSQSFDPGWKAYVPKFKIQNSPPYNGKSSWGTKFKTVLFEAFPFIFGREIKTHLKVNNWANGWEIDPSILNGQKSIVIVYLPQYLQYLGFILFTLPFLFIAAGKLKFILPFYKKVNNYFERKAAILRLKTLV